MSNQNTSTTVILPVMNETFSLEKTVEQILQNSHKDIGEIIIVYADKTTADALNTIDNLAKKHPDLILKHKQNLKFIGGAMQEAFLLSKGSHTIMMASDLETDPKLVPKLIELSKENPDAIVTVTRWIPGGEFNNYSRIKLISNWIFQRFFSLLYSTHLTDMTYAYRIFPTSLIKNIKWQELRHPFLFETIIKPLRLGIKTIEIPGVWNARLEGDSQNTFLRNFEYFKIGLKVRFTSPTKFILTKVSYKN